MLLQLENLPAQGSEYDVVVIGAGGAGLAAALFAGLAGQKVLLVEHSEYVGGTTALSGGTTWIPGTLHSTRVNPQDTLAEAARYLDKAIGERADPALRQAFLQAGPAVVAALEAATEVKFRPYPKHPDYISDLPGSTLNGRALEPLPFDGRLLGELFAVLRPPIPEFTVLGGMMVDRTDINHLLQLKHSLPSFRHSLKLLLRHASDRLSYPRGTRLVMGNALVGRLLYSLSKLGNVQLALRCQASDIQHDEGGVHGLTLRQGKTSRSIKVNQGVILASGGFNRDPEQRARLLPGIEMDWCPGAPGHTGQAQQLARGLGAKLAEGSLSPAFWAPVSLRRRADGSQAVFPHFMLDRAKPGMITVNARGARFVNESTSYHLFGLAMQEAHRSTPSIPAFLICDAAALRQYGIGMVRPGGKNLEPFLADGYLTAGNTLAELAGKLGMDASTLEDSVARNNRYAASGVDSDFHRGETAYQQNMGDPSRGQPNPNIGPLAEAPYYAVRLYPGDIGAATGLQTDTQARVLGRDGQPIAGLYAVGNDMHSIMGGVYTAPGITIGPALVFASIAATHASQRHTRALTRDTVTQ
ncbi:fumarate reductase flavoprotein subunit [Aquitalea magnusonii]|uniref:Fumarate reductase flavoprotein subunit n=1 Tax=Aquitalea magnusonii TaxID=332411 RepID=A0A3G9GI24_9NEIS|nr:FAD-dependent oxidoreductase [Aquitalea magnusonii]BBF85752.1 fumarate reductase flavoprotein subunit [Aquitalea magnusonii]